MRLARPGNRPRPLSVAPLRATLAVLAVLTALTILTAAAPHAARAQTPPPADTLALAGLDLAAGRVEAARTAYLALLTAGPPAQREAAWTGIVLASRADGDHQASAQHARALGRHAPPSQPPQSAQRILYLQALALRDGGDPDAATLLFRTVEAAAGPLAPVAHLRLAQAMAAAGRDVEAAAAFRATVARAGLPASLRPVARLEGAAAFTRLGHLPAALQLLDAAAADPSAGTYATAEARWDAASLRRDAGDDSWIDGAAALAVTAPQTPYAVLALDALEEAGIPVAPLQAAYVRYRSHANTAARDHYLAVLDAPHSADDAAAARFFLAAIDEREGDPLAAIDGYGRSLEASPSGWLAPDALWWRALLLADAGRHAEALEDFTRITRDFPASTFAPEAALAAALTHARAGHLDAAAASLRSDAAAGDAALAARAWRALTTISAPTAGLPHPADYAPGGIAALLSVTGAAASDPLPDRALTEWSLPTDTPDPATAWLAETFGPPPPAAPGAPATRDDPRLELGLALAAAAEQSVARAILYDLLRDRSGHPYELLEIARRASAAGLPDIGIAAAIGLLAPLSASDRLQAPSSIEQLAYPLPYALDLLNAATVERIPPLLLAALVRHESAFNPRAGSPAGALGLTQVIPPTGRQIAGSLGLPWLESDLLRADRSLRFGAHYLSQQLERFDGNLLAALAAYNGGPENAKRWLQQQYWPGPEGFIAAIDFAETRTYVERVIETYAWYRYLYADAPLPAIR